MEPTSVRKLQEEISLLQIDEDNKIRKILYTLTALVYDNISGLKINMDCMETLDFVFAKAKLSMDMKAIPVLINSNREIKIVLGRHPLLNHNSCVPLDFEIGRSINGVIITGPIRVARLYLLKLLDYYP